MSCLFSTQTHAMFEALTYSPEGFDSFYEFSLKKQQALPLPKRIISAPVLQNDVFDKSSEKIWTLKNRNSFLEETQKLIIEDGERQGKLSLPNFIKYEGDLQFPEDFEKIEKWMQLPHLQGFSIVTDESKNREFKRMYQWYKHFPKDKVDIRHKLIFMSLKSVLHQKNYVPDPSFSEECLNNHITYYYLLNDTKKEEM